MTALVELLPGGHDKPLQCRLGVANLADRPVYEALSYCWGDPMQTREIHLNQKPFAVTTNLHSALSKLRYADRSRKLWIDALCINQRDSAERSQQLLLMKGIYQRARRVVAWIGEETESVHHIKNLLHRLRCLHQNLVDFTYSDPDLTYLDSLGLPDYASPSWSHLRYFFRRPWFSRVWIIQEVVNASKLQVICGSNPIDWEDIVGAAYCIPESPMFATTDIAKICQHVVFIHENRTKVQEGNASRLDLQQMLHGSRRCDASDLRDKVYGLYPLIADQSRLPPPDYTKSVEEIYQETAVHIINTTGKLDILSYAGAARHPRMRNFKLPSWVPDWHAHDRSPPMATFFPTTAAPQNFNLESDTNHLVLDGSIEDEIASISDTIQPVQDTVKVGNINTILRDWSSAQIVLEPTGEQLYLRVAFTRETEVGSRGGLGATKSRLGPRTDITVKLLNGRRIFRSRRGLIGVISSYAAPGDKIASLCGASLLYAIRPADSGQYQLIGECILGQMEGQEQLGPVVATCRTKISLI
ncbi:het-domain protein [Fusarium sp. NRRL 52700]|nr:het-domain protein [Fusarium sp. NRRL 52700]